MSPIFRWLPGFMLTAILAIVSSSVAHGQDIPYSPLVRQSPVAERIRQIEREQLELELQRSPSPQTALFAETINGSATFGGDIDPFVLNNPSSATFFFTMPAHLSVLLARVISTSAFNLDLYVGIDRNGDHLAQGDEVVCASVGPPLVLEWCAALDPSPGQYWLVAYIFFGSGQAAETFTIDVTAFGPEVLFASSAAYEDGEFASAGDIITYTVEVQPPLPLSAPLVYTLTVDLPPGINQIAETPPGVTAVAASQPFEFNLVSSGAPVSATFSGQIDNAVGVDRSLVTRLTYAAGAARLGHTTTEVYVMGAMLAITATAAPTYPLAAAAPFTVTVANHGIRVAEHLTVTVDLPIDAEHVSGGTLEEGRLLWWIDRLDPGASVDLGFSLRLVADDTSARTSLTPSARIVGGEEVAPGAWPWNVALWDLGWNAWWGCSGSLIGRGWVLTAAHCVTYNHYVIFPQDIGVAVGRHNIHSTEGYVIGASEILVHPKFDYITRDNDVALIRLGALAGLNDTIGTVRLASWTDAAAYAEGALAIATGWGTQTPGQLDMPEGLRQVEVSMYANETCEADYEKLIGEATAENIITHNMICAGIPEGGRGVCDGDNGGPLVVRRGENGWQQVGITSWGYGCAEPHAPAVFSRVPRFLDWINQEIHTLQVTDYAVTDGTGLPGHAARGAQPATTLFTEVFSTVWIPIVAVDTGQE